MVTVLGALAFGLWGLGRDTVERDDRAHTPEATRSGPGSGTADLDPSPIETASRAERVDLRTEAVDAPTEVLPTATAELLVRVVDPETWGPVRGLELKALLGDQRGLEGKLEGTPQGDGRFHFESVPVGVPRLLSIRLNSTDGVELAREALYAFDPGERRSLDLQVFGRAGEGLWFRCVEDATGRPIGGVRVWQQSSGDTSRPGTPYFSGPTSARGDASGLVNVHPVLGGRALVLEAEGFAPGWVIQWMGGATREQARELRFTAQARLDVVLRTRDGSPVEGRDVVVLTDGGQLGSLLLPGLGAGLGPRVVPALEQVRMTGADGRASFDHLPLRQVVASGLGPQPLEHDIGSRTERGGGSIAPLSLGPVTLEPGERRELAFTVGAEARVIGRVLDQLGEPVFDEELRLVRSHAGVEPGPPVFPPGPRERATRTDAEGRFEFDGVSIGHWWLTWTGPGVSYALPSKVTVTAENFAFEVDGSAPELELLVPAWRGLLVRGSVTRAGGAPASGVAVSAAVPGTQRRLEVTSDDLGRFAIGPLLDVEHVVAARSRPPLFLAEGARTRPGDEPVLVAPGVRARPGDELQLVLAPTASFEGQIHWEPGPRPQSVVLEWFRAPPTKPADALELSPAALPDFEVGGLAPGVYTVVATTGDGRAGHAAGVVIPERGAVAGVELRLERGGTLRVRSRAQPGTSHDLMVTAGETILRRTSVEGGRTAVLTGLPRSFTLEARSGDGAPERFELGALAGEVAVVDVGTP